VLFVPIDDVLGSKQAILADDAKVFPLSCPFLQPVDPVSDARATACMADLTADATQRATCQRASAFHPNQDAQPLIARRIVEVLRDNGLLRTPFP
jgi:hypothetical protein